MKFCVIHQQTSQRTCPRRVVEQTTDRGIGWVIVTGPRICPRIADTTLRTTLTTCCTLFAGGRAFTHLGHCGR